MAKTAALSAGKAVIFKGFSSDEADRPDNWEALTEGEQYTIVDVLAPEEEGEEQSYLLEVPNPDDDDSPFRIDVFADEIEAAPAKTASSKRGASKAGGSKLKGGTTKAKGKGRAGKSAEEKEAAKAAKAAEREARKKAKEEEKERKRVERAVDPDLGKMIMLTEEEEDPEIIALIQGADDLNELVHELVEQHVNAEWQLGGVLYHARISKSYMEEDERYKEKGGFGLWVQEALGLEYRKAMYLCDIYSTFRRFGYGAEDLTEMGWGKASKIVPLMGTVDSDEARSELVSAAKEQTSADLTSTIKETKQTVTGGSTKEVRRNMSFKFVMPEENGFFVTELWEMIKTDMSEDNDALVFERLVNTYAEEHLGVSDMKTIKSKATRKLNAAKKERGETGKPAASKAKAGTKAKPKAKAAPKAKPSTKKSGGTAKRRTTRKAAE